MSPEPWQLSATELHAAFDRRDLSPVDVSKSILARIEQLNPILNCYCFFDPNTTLDQAKASEDRWMKGAQLGPLDGIPVSIKDVFPTRGWPTRYGSLATSSKGRWCEEDPAASRLREAGTVFLGKTNTPEFGNSGITDNLLFGRTVNPWNTELTPGGSSGGSAAAVAAGLGPVSIGTDAGGSIRTPASFCGVVGMKPSFGRVPQFPGSDYCRLSCTGPITRSVTDAALVLSAIAKPDHRDPNALPPCSAGFFSDLDIDIGPLRIAWSTDLGYMPVDPDIEKVFRDALEAIRPAAVSFKQVDPPVRGSAAVFNKLWPVAVKTMVRHLSSDRLALLGPDMQHSLQEAEKTSLDEFIDADRQREQLCEDMRRFHQDFDLLITPTAIVPPFAITGDMPPHWNEDFGPIWELSTFPFNMSRQPAISIPCGFTAAGLPVGMQIVGPLYKDDLVLRAAYQFEHALSLPAAFPPLTDRLESL